jgi:hypothetical protein
LEWGERKEARTLQVTVLEGHAKVLVALAKMAARPRQGSAAKPMTPFSKLKVKTVSFYSITTCALVLTQL